MPTLHIFPSQAAAEAFSRSRLDICPVQCGTPSLTLRDLTRKLAHASLARSRPLSPIGEKLLLADIISRHYGERTGCFSRLSGFPGFTDALAGVVAELKHARVTHEMLRTCAGGEAVRELGDLFDLYERTLAEKEALDRHDSERMAVEQLQEGLPLPQFFDGVTAVTVHHIYDLTPLQLSLLAALSRRLPVELRLPYHPDDTTIFACVSRTADAIEALDNSDLNLNPVFCEPEGTFVSSLLPLVINGGTAAHVAPGNMALMTAPGAYSECEEIGRRIRALLEEGTDPGRIAVLFRNLNRYGPMMEDVFHRFGIPISYRRGAPLSTAPLVRAALSPFATAASRFAREDVVAFCTSSYLDISNESGFVAALPDVLTRCGYISEVFGTAPDRIGRLIAAMEGRGENASAEKRVGRRLGSILLSLAPFGENNSVAGFTKLLEDFLERYGIYRHGVGPVSERILKRDASSIVQFQQLLADLKTDSACLGLDSRRVSPSEYLQLLHRGMEGMFLAGERSSGVSVMNFHDARGLRFPHLFIGGLNEDGCPQRHESHPLFKDGDKVLVRKSAGIAGLKTAREKGEEEPLLFWLAMAVAEQSLTLSCCYADSRGNEVLRSPFLDELLEKVPLTEEKIRVSRITVPPEECREREELLNSLAFHHLFEPPPEAEEAIAGSLARIAANASIEQQRELFFSAQERSIRQTLATPHTGLLASPEIAAELARFYESERGRRISPTGLEEYGSCPFRYFLRRLVRLATVDEPALEPAAREVGTLAHLLLKEFFLRMQRDGRLPIRDEHAAREVLHEVAEQTFLQWENDHHPSEPLLWELEKESLIPLLEKVVAAEAADTSELVPHLFEHRIEPPLMLSGVNGDTLEVAGTIDRVDVDREGRKLRIVDYKLGGNRPKYQQLLKKEFMGETSFQIPLYLLAAARDMAGEAPESLDGIAARYWLLKKAQELEKDFAKSPKEDFTGFFSVDPEERKKLGDGNFLNRLWDTVYSMKSGDFRITPRECGACDFPTVCRYIDVNLRDTGADADKTGSGAGGTE